MKKHAALALGLLVVPVALAGCSSGGSGATVTVTQTVTAKTTVAASPAATADAANKATKAAPKVTKKTTAAADSQTKGTTPLGATWTSETGRKITVSKPVPFVPSEDAITDDPMPGARYYKVTITLTNPADADAYDTNNLTNSATSGSTEVDGVYDGSVGNEPDSTLLPGRSITWAEGFPVVPGTHLSLQFDDMSSFSTLTIFDGKVA